MAKHLRAQIQNIYPASIASHKCAPKSSVKRVSQRCQGCYVDIDRFRHRAGIASRCLPALVCALVEETIRYTLQIKSPSKESLLAGDEALVNVVRPFQLL